MPAADQLVLDQSAQDQPVLRAPFPWFGGKRRVAPIVWRALGEVPNYVEPFYGSGAVLLGRPADNPPATETVNDRDGFISNFWRSIQQNPGAVAHWADNPINESDLHARHAYLTCLRDELSARLEGDPAYYDPLIAGWWCWGISSWIGSGWCSGRGPWHAVDGLLVRCGGSPGVSRQLPHISAANRGVCRQSVILCEHFARLASRLRHVRVCCGDWARICQPSATTRIGLTGVFLDPPYGEAAGRDPEIYSVEDTSVARAVRDWAIKRGDDPRMRIAVCGYEGEHEMPATWTVHEWTARGGYGNQGKSGNPNRRRERIWFSPHCLPIGDPQEIHT